MVKSLTPLEIFERKKKWASKFNLQVDIDSLNWGISFCNDKFDNTSWSVTKFTRPDDSHTFSFEHHEDFEVFNHHFKLRNPNFDSDTTFN